MATLIPSQEDAEKKVIAWLKLKTQDDEVLKDVVATTRAFVASLPVAALNARDDAETVELRTIRVRQGVVMLASRLYRRRNSPGGVEAVSEAGVQYVARHDSDVSRLLGLDQFAAPQVG